MKKKILKDFVLTEISGVDRPAQPTAKMTIMKRESEAGSSGDINPDGEKMSEELTKKVAELEKALGETKTELEKANKTMADMKAEEDKKKKMEEMQKNDETVEVAGQVIAKSAVGEASFAVFKAQAEQIAKAEERIAKAEEAAEMAKLEKRASEEFKHVPGTASDVAKMLKALGGMEESVAKNFEAVLKSVEEKNAVAFTTIGKSFGPAAGGAEEKLEKAAEEIRKSAPGMTKEQALVKAYEEHPELVKELA